MIVVCKPLGCSMRPTHVTDIVTIICSARQKWHEILSRPIPDVNSWFFFTKKRKDHSFLYLQNPTKILQKKVYSFRNPCRILLEHSSKRKHSGENNISPILGRHTGRFTQYLQNSTFKILQKSYKKKFIHFKILVKYCWNTHPKESIQAKIIFYQFWDVTQAVLLENSSRPRVKQLFQAESFFIIDGAKIEKTTL